MEEALRRLIDASLSEGIAGVLSSETAQETRTFLNAKHETDVETKPELRERFE